MTSIPDPPEKAKNAFAVTLFCIETAFDSRSKDFLKYAFDSFPDRDYLIVTQPHTVAETSLLQKFTSVKKKPENTFQHVLYVIHRDCLLDSDMQVRRATQDDIDNIQLLTADLGNKEDVNSEIYDGIINPEAKTQTYVAKIYGSIIGAFVVSKDVNLPYYKSHFHIQDSILLSEHDKKCHARLKFAIVNPIFERSTRVMLKEVLRLTAKTCLYFEIHNRTVIPTIFDDLIHVRSRRFPHFLEQKWNHERNIYEENDDEIKDYMDGHQRDPLDEDESSFSLCFTTRRLLSEPKIIKNSRIVVVGASDTTLSFIEALLSISYLSFTNIILVSPGGLPHHHFQEKKDNLKAYSTSYTNDELKRLMLENRIRVVDARMVDIDRGDKNVILGDETLIPYDTLILGMGLQDKTLNSVGFISRGIAPLIEGKQRIEGLISIDDPYLYQHLRSDGTLMQIITNRKSPQNVIVYGRTLHTYCCIQGLIERGVKPQNIFLMIPDETCHVEENYNDTDEMSSDLPFINPDAFEDEYITEKIHTMLENLGITIYQHTVIMKIYEDDDNALRKMLFKRLDIPDDEEEDDDDDEIGESQRGMEGEGSEGEGEGEDAMMPKKKRKKNELEVECKLLITAGHRDVDLDVFKSIHNNGLVYNGRLIVDKNFQSTDPSIFASGSLCEFSGRYKALAQGRPLRLDRYNGREMGSRLARSVFDIYDPSISAAAQEQSSLSEEEIPNFFLPQG